MSRLIAILLTVAALCMPLTLAFADEATPDATIALKGGSVAAGVGFSWGSGTLTYKGKDYPITAHGFDVGDVGISNITASAKVYNLKKLQDFDGNYTAVVVGAAATGGASALTMQNQNGVKVDLVSTTQGVKITMAVGGVKMKLKK